MYNNELYVVLHGVNLGFKEKFLCRTFYGQTFQVPWNIKATLHIIGPSNQSCSTLFTKQNRSR